MTSPAARRRLFRPTPTNRRIVPVYWAEKLVPGSGSEAKEHGADRARAYVRQAATEAVKTHDHIQTENAEEWLFSDFSWAEFDTEAALMRTLGRFEGRVEAGLEATAPIPTRG